MFIFKLAHRLILTSLLAILCATGNAGVAESTVQICSRAWAGLYYVSCGTGFVVSGNRVITAGHVVEEPKNYVVRDANGDFHEIKAIWDGYSDSAILYCPTVTAPPLPVRPDPLPDGEYIMAFGDYKPGKRVVEWRDGYVRDIFWQGEYQGSTVEGVKGFSGGPVVDRNGRVVGILSWRNSASFEREMYYVPIGKVLE